MPYVDLNTIHNPATATIAPASWGDQTRDNFEFLVDPPACSVFNNAAQSVAVGSAVLTANSENYDNNGMHSTVTNTSRITATTAGRYLVIATIECAASATGERDASLRVNGTTVFQSMRVGAAATGLTVRTVSRTLVLAVNDYVEVLLGQNSGGNLNVFLREFAATFQTR
jgi:hypothetical protein